MANALAWYNIRFCNWMFANAYKIKHQEEMKHRPPTFKEIEKYENDQLNGYAEIWENLIGDDDYEG